MGQGNIPQTSPKDFMTIIDKRQRKHKYHGIICKHCSYFTFDDLFLKAKVEFNYFANLVNEKLSIIFMTNVLYFPVWLYHF